MTLEFDKVMEQVARMGRALAQRNITESERLAIAWEWLQGLDDLDAIRARIQLARERDAGFRGAAPLAEAVNAAYPLPARADPTTIIAADGSQVYPSLHAAAIYYLTNIGLFIFHHGEDHLPETICDPRLHYAESQVYDSSGQVITSEAVNARRNVLELQALAAEVWRRRESDRPLLAMRDGQLLFWVGKDVPDRRRLEADYMGALVHLHDAHAALSRASDHSASLIGYVDRPTSAFIIMLLHLMSLDDIEVRQATLKTRGLLDGLTDRPLMVKLLGPGDRSALLVQQSPQNKAFHDKGESYEIVFFYLNVSRDPQHAHLARVEMPMWVARDADRVDDIHALVYEQCQLMWRYPYALARADELAVVRTAERTQLNNLIEVELRRNDQAVEHSEKLDSKVIRHGRRRYGR